MSTIVCGKRSFFDDMDPEISPPPAFKKYRCSSSGSPVRFVHSPTLQATPVDQLKGLFPQINIELLEKALEESGNNLDLAIKRLQELSLRYSNGTSGSIEEDNSTQVKANPNEESNTQGPQVQNIPRVDGAEWVDLLLKEMTCVSSMEEARSRVANVLESFEKLVSSGATAEAAQAFIKENELLKGHIEVLHRDNIILKRGIAIQHERQKEYNERNQEVHELRQMVNQCQEQIRILEMKNYGLALHLRQSQQSSSIPGHFHPDIF